MEYIDKLRYFLVLILAFLLPYSAMLGAISAQPYAPDGVSLKDTFYIRSAGNNQYLSASGSGVHLRPLNKSSDAFLWALDPVTYTYPCYVGMRRCDRRTKNETLSHFGGRFYKIVNLKSGQFLGRSGGGFYIGTTVDGRHLFWEVKKDPRQPNGNAHILRVANKPLNKTQWPLPATKFYQLTQRGRGVVATANAISAATGKQIETAPPANQVWHMEPGPKRDLVKLTIHSVKAIQTSTGRDGATDVLMRGVEIAIEYGPSFATGGGAAAVANGAKAAAAAAKAAALAAKQGFKSGGKKIGKQLATHGVKGTFKGIGKGIGKKFAEKTLTQLLKEGASKTAQKEIKKAARKALKEKIKKAALQQVAKLKAKVVKKMKMLRTYAKDPKKALTMKNLGKTGKRAHSQLTKHLKKKRLQEMADTANARSKKFAGIGVENIKKQNAVNAAKAGAALPASGPDQAIGKLDYDIFSSLEPTEHEFGLAREAYAALEYTESAEVKNSIKMCESWEAYIPPQSPIFVMSESGLTKFSKQAKELHEALVAAGAGPAAKSMNEIYVDAFAMPSGWLERGLAPFIDNTPDQLEIKIHGNSLWPNGGGDWRDIKKGETKNVGVEVVMDRTKGVNIQLIEYDSGSNDDNLGRLQFKTAGMRRAETFKHAFVHHSGEGSLYGINFTIAPFNNGSTKQDAAESRAMVACKNVKKAYDAVEWKFTKLEWYVNARKKIFDKYGLEGIAVYENSMDWMDAKACPAKNENYRKLLAGEWRVGRYDNSTAEKDRSATWTYTFTADGKVVTPTSTGEWRTRSYIDVDRFGSARDASDDRNTSPRSCELYLAFHDEKGRLGGGDFYGRGLTEELFPIRTEDSGLTIYKYDKKSTSNAILNMARKAFYNTDFGEYPNKKSAVPKARAGLDLWMEKIAGPQDKSQETAEKIQTNADAIIGIWDPVVGRNNPAGYGNTWTFASDNLFVSTIFNKKSLGGSYNTVDEMNAALYYRRSITGRWENLTDNRIKVTLDKDNRFRDFGFNNLKNDFIVDLVYTISPGSQPDLFIQYPAGDKLVEANKRQTIVKYIGLSDQSIEALEKIRIARGMPVPEVEREDYERFYAKRKQNWTAELVGLEEERQREIKSAVYWANQKVGEKALAVKAAFHSHGKCGAFGQERKGNFIGEWAVGLHNRLGNKVTLPAGDANWTFEADGTLRGKMGGKDWSAKWSEVNGCKATATLDAAIAAHFKLEPKITFDLAFVENGDRILSISETEKAITISYGNFNSGFADYPGPILAASGAQKSTDENRARYVLKYDQLVITRAGAANRCSPTWTNALVRPGMGPKGTPQVGFDISSVIAGSYSQWQTIGIYKVNFGGPEAIPLGEVNFHGANTIDINGPVRHNYSGIAGDEFVILNKLNECVNVSETSDIITPVRKVSRYRNKQFTKKYGPILLVETNVYNNKNFSTKE
ncbi:MAG: hypothetical protein JKY99_03150, partial [Rhizobiales bacterium]|nr:hypothetical protein [Hyphomicrobiales bacterium]